MGGFVDSRGHSLCTACCLEEEVDKPSSVPSGCAIAVAAFGPERKATPAPLQEFSRLTLQSQKAGERYQHILKSDFLLNKFTVRREKENSAAWI